MRKHHKTPGNRTDVQEAPIITYRPKQETHEKVIEMLNTYGSRQRMLDAAVECLYNEWFEMSGKMDDKL